MLIWLIAAAWGLALGLAPLLLRGVLGGRAMWIPVGAVPLSLLTGLTFARVLRGSYASEIAAAYVTAGYCGSCCYPLESASVQADGCTVCSECGAAWKRPPD